MVTTSRNITESQFGAATGWEIRPEGACKGDVCVPLGGGPFDAAEAAQRLGIGVARDAELNLWSFGPETIAGRALASAVAPELALKDLDGNEFRLSSLRGRKSRSSHGRPTEAARLTCPGGRRFAPNSIPRGWRWSPPPSN